MRFASLSVAVAAFSMLSVTGVQACSFPYLNAFAHFGEPPGLAQLREARFIDWVEVVAKGDVVCERDGPLTYDMDGPEYVAWGGPTLTAEGFETSSCNHQRRKGPVLALEARVVESIKGEGTSSFPLAYGWTRSSSPQFAYSDPRAAAIDVEDVLAENHAGAAAWHRDAAFNDYGVLHEDMDDTDSCGGRPTAMVGGRYLAFRNAAGSVLGLEPAVERDDPWFDRVRRYATDPEAFRPPLELADFFRASDGVALVKLRACSGRQSDTTRAKVRVEWLRGRFKAGAIGGYVAIDKSGISSNWSPKADPDAFWWIADYLDRIGASCGKGMTLLLVSGPFDAGGLSPPRLARVDGGRFSKSDLLTGYRLEGAESVSIEQVFAWVEEGTLSRRSAPRSLPLVTGRGWWLPPRIQ